MHNLHAFVAKNPALQKDLQTIEENKNELREIYAAKLKSCIAKNKTMEDILEAFFIHELEYNVTYKNFDVGSHNDPVSDAGHKLDYDLTINEVLDEILLQAAADVNLDMKAFKKELGQYLHRRS